MITSTKRIAYGLLTQAVLLLVLYAAATLLTSVKFLADDPLAAGLPYQQIAAVASIALNLAALTGLLGGGVYVIADDIQHGAFQNERLLGTGYWLWTLLVVLAFFAGVLGETNGRQGLEMPFWLAVLETVALAVLLAATVTSTRRWTPFALVWTLGIALSGVCILISLIPPADYARDRALRALALGLNGNVAYVLAAAALGFWLMTRFSNVVQRWADEGLYTIAGLLAIAGVLASIPPLYILGGSSALGGVALFVVPLCYLIFAAHSYRALRDRNPTETLAAHWYALGLLLYLLGIGVLGAVQALPGVVQWTLGTRLTDLQSTLTSFAAAAIVLGVANQVVAELRGENKRITGLTPFWFVAFGIIGGAVALGGAGLVQVYLERILGIGYLETQVYLIPLYVLWIVGGLSVAAGVGLYAIAFRARRPEEREYL